MNDLSDQINCGRVLKQLLHRKGPEWLGYWIQGIAAHIMLRLGVINIKVKTTGHPDIEGYIDGGVVRVEIECDTTGGGLHNLTAADIYGLMPRSPLDQAHYGLLNLSYSYFAQFYT